MKTKTSLVMIAILTLLLAACSQTASPRALAALGAAQPDELQAAGKADPESEAAKTDPGAASAEEEVSKALANQEKAAGLKESQGNNEKSAGSETAVEVKSDSAGAEVSSEKAALAASESKADQGSEKTALVSAPNSCPVTTAPETPFVPPAPYPKEYPYGGFWFGSENLWVGLRSEGVWQQLPKDANGYVQKTLWLRQGYSWTEEPQPELFVSGRRLGGPAPALIAHEATNGFHPDIHSFMLVGVTIPIGGCWEITGRYGGHELSYIVWVED
jgi:hypothetical protein